MTTVVLETIGEGSDPPVLHHLTKETATLAFVPSQHPERKDPDERVTIPLDPEDALRALLAVDPDEEPAENEDPDES